eukprot:m.50805 g.50805  ORF g.50805 m.50805 type:complete len:527 (+) comp7535_c0_seq1:393-1973(+)
MVKWKKKKKKKKDVLTKGKTTEQAHETDKRKSVVSFHRTLFNSIVRARTSRKPTEEKMASNPTALQTQYSRLAEVNNSHSITLSNISNTANNNNKSGNATAPTTSTSSMLASTASSLAVFNPATSTTTTINQTSSINTSNTLNSNVLTPMTPAPLTTSPTKSVEQPLISPLNPSLPSSSPSRGYLQQPGTSVTPLDPLTLARQSVKNRQRMRRSPQRFYYQQGSRGSMHAVQRSPVPTQGGIGLTQPTQGMRVGQPMAQTQMVFSQSGSGQMMANAQQQMYSPVTGSIPQQQVMTNQQLQQQGVRRGSVSNQMIGSVVNRGGVPGSVLQQPQQQPQGMVSSGIQRQAQGKMMYNQSTTTPANTGMGRTTSLTQQQPHQPQQPQRSGSYTSYTMTGTTGNPTTTGQLNTYSTPTTYSSTPPSSSQRLTPYPASTVQRTQSLQQQSHPTQQTTYSSPQSMNYNITPMTMLNHARSFVHNPNDLAAIEAIFKDPTRSDNQKVTDIRKKVQEAQANSKQKTQTASGYYSQ